MLRIGSGSLTIRFLPTSANPLLLLPHRDRHLQWSNCLGFDLAKLDLGASGLTGEDALAEVYVSSLGSSIIRR